MELLDIYHKEKEQSSTLNNIINEVKHESTSHQGKATLKPPRNTRPNQALIHPITLQLPKCNFF